MEENCETVENINSSVRPDSELVESSNCQVSPHDSLNEKTLSRNISDSNVPVDKFSDCSDIVVISDKRNNAGTIDIDEIVDVADELSGKDLAVTNVLNTSYDKESIMTTSTESPSSVSSYKTLSPKTPLSAKKPHTPKQMAKFEEKQRKRKEHEKLMTEKKKQKEEENMKKQQIIEEKKEERMKVKLEKQKRKLEEKEAKLLEKEVKRLKKEEETKTKEDLKKKKENEKIQQEEDERKKKEKLKAKFVSYFLNKKDEVKQSEEDASGKFLQFQVKEKMQLAPVSRVEIGEESKCLLDSILEESDFISETYLNILKQGNYIPKSSFGTYELCEKPDEDDECEIIDDSEMEVDDEEFVKNIILDNYNNRKKMRAKLLQFCENCRPPYWGTWTKSSSIIKPKMPLVKDEKFFNYDYDSDDDWEEEENGESLSDTDEEEVVDDIDNQYEVDNDFFVPHGYLSDDEGREDEDEDQNKQEDKNVKKEMLEHKQAEFEKEMSKKTKKLKPRIYGCFWLHEKNNPELPIGNTSEINSSVDVLETILESEKNEENHTAKKFYKHFPEEAIPHLIKLLHGNSCGKPILAKEFYVFWNEKFTNSDEKLKENVDVNSCGSPACKEGGKYLSKRKIEKKIQELGEWGKCPEDGPFYQVMMWYVPEVVREKYGMKDLSPENQWPMKFKKKDDSLPQDVNDDTLRPAPKASPLSLITRFTKVLTEEEMKKKLLTPSKPVSDTVKSELFSEINSARPKPVKSEESILNEQLPQQKTSLLKFFTKLPKHHSSNATEEDDSIVLD